MKTEQNRLLVAEAGLPYLAHLEGDAIDAWLDLMETVEALCPTMPPPELKLWRDYRL